MASSTEQGSEAATPTSSKKGKTGHWIALGLILGLLCGLMFGEYCEPLQDIGTAYVGLLQMTVLPYLVLSLIGKMARLDVAEARELGIAALVVLLVLWLIAIGLIVLVSGILPPIDGASFYSPEHERVADSEQDFLMTFIPTNVFRSLSNEYVPAVVVFCLFLGFGLMLVPGKERVLDLLDLVSTGVGRINSFLVRLAPFGLFTLTAAASGTMRLEEFSRLQAYLIMFSLACVVAAFAALPLLLSSLSDISYRDLLRAAEEPMLTAIAAGKLFVVLPQITENCEALLKSNGESTKGIESTPSVLVPLAYPFPHVGKILSCVFISFAAWYVGQGLTPVETAEMATKGVLSSFASPLVTIPYLLDQYRLPQDLMALFILPGFITTRLADVVGVMHLMVLTLLVTLFMKGQLQIRLGRLLISAAAVFACLFLAGAASRSYLATTSVDYDLDERLLALEIPVDHDDVIVYRVGDDIPVRPQHQGSTLDRIKSERVLRVGYHPEHMPYTFFNSNNHLVGMDVELMHRLAARLEVRLEFVPINYDSVVERLENGEVDVATGGLMVNPERLMRVGFTKPYQAATIAVIVPEHLRKEFASWENPSRTEGLRLGTIQGDVALAAARRLENVQTAVISSIGSYFSGEKPELDGLIMIAEEGAAWNVLYPEYALVVPTPITRRPVAMAARSADTEWLLFLDRWIDFKAFDGSLERATSYWVEGGGTQTQEPRWSIIRNVLHWVE